MTDPATTVQDDPYPKPIGRPVLPDVLHLLGDYPNIQRDYRARIELGAKLYGQELTSHNGRCFLTDAYQEALDLLGYLVGMSMERPDVRGVELHAIAMSTAHTLAAVTALRTLLDLEGLQ